MTFYNYKLSKSNDKEYVVPSPEILDMILVKILQAIWLSLAQRGSRWKIELCQLPLVFSQSHFSKQRQISQSQDLANECTFEALFHKVNLGNKYFCLKVILFHNGNFYLHPLSPKVAFTTEIFCFCKTSLAEEAKWSRNRLAQT